VGSEEVSELPLDPGATDDVGHFRVRRECFLDADGSVHGELPDFARDRAEVVTLYQAMLLTRFFDEKAVALQRTGRLGTFASSLGQEAVSVGVASAMGSDDVLVPSFRDQGAQLWRGVSMEELLLYWGGDERGSDFSGPRDDFPVNIPVASHVLHAAGVALAFKLRGERRSAVCLFGDGATSKGDFYEGLNLAGIWRLPAVFVITNNRWAISVPREAQTAAATLAQKAIAAGMEGVQVDGNDVFAVRHVVEAALARTASAPTLIEALTYRLADHTTADDASRYRDDTQTSRHWQQEPVSRLKRYLSEHFDWSKQEEEALLQGARERVEESARRYLETQALSATAMFDHLYQELPKEVAIQRAEVAARSAQGERDD
jgi:pyruvate dehydrogenase E1 component alpha subunit